MKLDENALVPLGGYESARSWVQMKLQEFARAINRRSVLNGGNQFTGTQAVGFVTLTDGVTITIDGSLSNNFIVTLAGNRTLANPTNMRDGAYYNVWVKQDGTGSRSISFGSKFVTPANETITLSTGANALDILTFQYNAALDVAALVAIKNFS